MMQRGMLRKIVQTVGMRYVVALLNLALIFINAKILGAEGMGLAGIVVASVGLVTVACSVLCGNTIVYYMNRFPAAAVVRSAYGWALVASLVTSLLLFALGMVPTGFELHIFFLALLQTSVAINSRFLLAIDRVWLFNQAFFLQGGTLFFFVSFFYFVLKMRDVHAYVYAIYMANALACAVSTYHLLRFLRTMKPKNPELLPPFFRIFKEMFAYGLWAGVDNLAENCCTRINYFLLQHFAGLGSVGLLDAGTRISESVFHISRSVSFLAYGEVARTNVAEEQRKIASNMFKTTVLALTVAMLLILLLPEWVYTDYLFSQEFVGVKHVIAALAAGIVALGSNSILSHFFIGTGRVRTSATCSVIGLCVLLVAGLFLIPQQGALGAALSSSIAFGSMLLFSLHRFHFFAKTE